MRALQRKVWGDISYGNHEPARRSARRFRGLGVGAIALGAVLLVFGIGGTGAYATKPNPDHIITLCHRTDSCTNPYVVITVDIASVHFEGHDGHNGPVFHPAIPKHEKWGDIIPPFNFGLGKTYPGKNWTANGIAIFNNACNAPQVTTTTAAPTTTTHPTTTTTASTTTTVEGSTTTTLPSTSTTVEVSTTPGSSTTTAPGASSTTTSSTTVPNTDTTTSETTSTRPNATTTTTAGAVDTLGDTTTTITSTGPLPFTGSSATTALSAIGLGLIGAGLGLLRKRRLRA